VKLSLLTRDERDSLERRVVQAFARGVAECESDVTWADPARPLNGALTALDDAYDMGRTWAFNHFLDRVTL